MAASPFTQTSLNSLEKPDQTTSNPFSDPTPDSDLILVVEEQELHVNKVVLSLASPVFKTMFEAEFKEKSCKEITLPDKNVANMLEFLLCIYPSSYKPVTSRNLDSVLPLAHEYQVQQLIHRCEEFVLNRFQMHQKDVRDPPLKELVHFLFLADKYDLKHLLKECVAKMAARSYTSHYYVDRTLGSTKCAEDEEQFKMVSIETKYEILLKRMRLLEPLADKVARGVGDQEQLRKTCFGFIDYERTPGFWFSLKQKPPK